MTREHSRTSSLHDFGLVLIIRLTVFDQEGLHQSYGRLPASGIVKLGSVAPSVVVVMRRLGNPGMPVTTWPLGAEKLHCVQE